MAIISEFFKHNDFKGKVSRFVTGPGLRWHWITFGPLANEISSIRCQVTSGRKVNLYAFNRPDFDGEFASLNVPSGWTCWWPGLGSMNDKVESAFILRREGREIVQSMRDLLLDDFIARFDEGSADKAAKRRGEPTIRALIRTPYDPDVQMVALRQPLTIELDCWSDYDAWVQFDMKFWTVNGKIKGECAWVTTWVEGGVFSQRVFDELHPEMLDAGRKLSKALKRKFRAANDELEKFGIRLRDVYIIPGEQPSFPPRGDFGRFGDNREDCCLVLVKDRNDAVD
jgi:hypothetical protein